MTRVDPGGFGWRGGGLGLAAWIALVAIVGAGCDDDEARFDLMLSVENGCLADFFPFEPEFFAASATEFGAMLRMQADSRVRTQADAFYISIADDNAIVGDCPAPSELAGSTVDVAPGACVQAFFRINQSCRSRFFDPQVFGQVTFERLGFERGDVIEGTVTGTLEDYKVGRNGAELVESRTLLGTLEGRFRFTVEVGPPYQTYSTPNRPARP